MKKLRFFLTSIFLLCCCAIYAYDFEVNGIYYSITSSTDRTVKVTFLKILESEGFIAYSDYSGTVTIPKSVIYNGRTYSVTNIGDNAFYNCSSLTSVVIPNSVTSIGVSAFRNCSGLISVEIPNSVTSIRYGAFEGCSSLTSVVIPNSVTSIETSAFEGCSSLTSVEIGNSVTSIGESVFGGCSSLTSVEIGNSVTSIGLYAFYGTAWYNNQPDGVVYLDNYLLGYKGTMASNTSIEIKDGTLLIADNAFSNCSSLISVEIPNSVTSIGIYAFRGCSGLTSVKIPNSVTSIGEVAFMDCSGLTSVEITNSVTSIEYSTFCGCSSLTSVVIPNSVTSIGAAAFRDCSGLTSVEIPNSVTSIGTYAFYNCFGLTSMEIPNSVTSIGTYAFYECYSLTSVEIPNSVTSIGDAAFIFCSGLTSVVIPNSVTSIGANAFYGCSDLTSVEIGNSVTSIGAFAFDYCSRLKSVTSLNSTPPTLSNFIFDNYDATLYVPSGAKTAYSEAEYWKNFTNIEELEPSIYELTDGEEYNEASDMTLETLTYTRTLPNLYWNALYVPFELPYDVIADRYDVAYINDVNGYDTDGNGTIDDLAMEIITIKGGTLKANYPYLIKAKTEADKAVSITVEDATLYAAEENAVDCSSVYQNYIVKGTYTKKTAEELAGKLAISTSGAWQPLAEGTALNPFRLYLSIENRDNSPLKVEPAALSRMRIVERGETTGIEEVVPSQQREDVIFDLSGRRVKQAVKGGVYIVNGKKRIL